MAVERLQENRVRQWDNQMLVDQHELLSRLAHKTDGDVTLQDLDTLRKNLSSVTAELFRRLRNYKS